MPEVSPEELVAAGRVLRPHGLSGEVLVEVWTDFPERFEVGRRLLARGSARLQPLVIEASRPHKGQLLVKFAGVDTVEAAGEFRDADLCVDPADPVRRPEGYFFHHELRGLRVLDTGGTLLGEVLDLEEIGPAALLVVQTPKGRRDVPFSQPIVVSVEMEKGCVVLDPPRGLLD